MIELIGVITMELDYINLGARIANRRKQSNIKQNELAEHLKISNNYLSSIERGREKPSLDILVKICNALNVTPDYLLMGTMHSSTVPRRIIDSLQLCSSSDITLLLVIVEAMVKRNSEKWNGDNFI